MWTETTTNIPVLVLLEKYNHYYHQVGRNHVAENSDMILICQYY